MKQISTPPDLRVWAALGGSGCSLGLLLLLFGKARAEGEDGLQMFAIGLLLGLSLDTGLRGLTGTLDLIWIPGPWSWLIVITLVGAFGYALCRVTSYLVTPVDREAIDNLYPEAILLDYGTSRRNPAYGIERLLRDYVVQPDPANPDLLLGKAYLAMGALRLYSNFFVLERLRLTSWRP